MWATVMSKRDVIGLLLFTVGLTAGEEQVFVDTPQAVKAPAAIKTHGPNEVPTPLASVAAAPSRPRPQRSQTVPQAGPKREEPGMYLDPSITGAEGCYNPDSPALRSALKLPPPKSDSVFVASDLAADIRTLHGFMLRNYVLAGELLQRAAHDGHVLGGEVSVPNYFDINAFFSRWEKAVLAWGRSITFGDGVLSFMKEWRAHVEDEHFGPRIDQIAPPLVEYQAPLRGPIEVTSCKLSAGDARLDTFRMSKTLDENGEEYPILTVSAPALAGLGRGLVARCTSGDVELRPRVSTAKKHDATAPAYEFQSFDDGKPGRQGWGHYRSALCRRWRYCDSIEKACYGLLRAPQSRHSRFRLQEQLWRSG